MEKSESIKSLAEALVKVQSVIKPAQKTATNPFFHSTYATLEDVIDVIRKPLSDNGLAFTQLAGGDGTNMTVTTMLMHVSGEWISGTMTMKPVKNDPQGLGSCLSYMKRYGISALVGVSTGESEDDDGNAASQPETLKSTNKPKESGYGHDKMIENKPDTFWEFEDKNKVKRIGVVPGKVYTHEVLRSVNLGDAFKGKFYSPVNWGEKDLSSLKTFLNELKKE